MACLPSISLSPYAVCIHHQHDRHDRHAWLQELWDNGNRLVSLLDDPSWQALAELEAASALAVVDEVAEAMVHEDIRDVNTVVTVRPAPQHSHEPLMAGTRTALSLSHIKRARSAAARRNGGRGDPSTATHR